MSWFTTTISMFLIMNSIGHITAFLELVDSLDTKKRQVIVVREMLIALIFMMFFYFIGDLLLKALGINDQTISLAGGLILFLIAIRMIFPRKGLKANKNSEPFIFPIAMPMIAGPSILTTIMLYSYQKHDNAKVIISILIAWIFSITILLFAQNIKNILGQRALIAIERLMGLLLTMMAVEMLLLGIKSLILNGIS